MKYYKMSQQLSQLVQELKVTPNKIEDQTVSEYTNRECQNYLFNVIHVTLRQDLVKLNKPALICQELKELAISFKKVSANISSGEKKIFIFETVKVSQT